MKQAVMFFVAAFALVLSTSVHAATWYVEADGSGDAPTIQAGIDSAAAGDTVLLANGTFTGSGNKDLNFKGKAITVRSENGPDNCIIDCQEDGRGFYFHTGETETSALDGIKITNGVVHVPLEDGGAVYCSTSSPTITNCTITGNRAGTGGGISCMYNSNPSITECRITDNYGDVGGGIFCYEGSSPMITNCTVEQNRSNNGGGGFDCQFSSNPTITNCKITDNRGSHGGGVRCSGSCSPTITNCKITADTAVYYGGGIYCSGSGSSPAITNCTISRNIADWNGGGLVSWGSTPTVTNCILWGDAPEEIYLSSGGSSVVTYSDVQGGWPGLGNINADPLFVNPGNENYHLSAGSPCIDAGNDLAVPPDSADLDADGDTGERAPLDLDYNRRFVDDPSTVDTGVPDPPDHPEVVDMGAYEFHETAAIPTLSEWGTIILATLLVLSAWVVLRRRKAVLSRQ